MGHGRTKPAFIKGHSGCTLEPGQEGTHCGPVKGCSGKPETLILNPG